MNYDITGPKVTFFPRLEYLRVKERLADIRQPIVMGILNVSPDSFYAPSRVSAGDIADRAGKMLEEGAAILDVGAVSSRPGSVLPGEAEETDRLLPVVEEIHRAFPRAWISVDTGRAGVARRCVEAGAGMVNDIYGGRLDEEMAPVMASLHVPYVLMHMQGMPETMQANPHYGDVVKEVAAFFSERIDHFHRHGVTDIILDPGFGFGKSRAHNFELIRNLSYFRCLELPVMIGVSRKSSIAQTLHTGSEGALHGTTTLHTLALEQGARILRVHDVQAAADCIKIWETSQ